MHVIYCVVLNNELMIDVFSQPLNPFRSSHGSSECVSESVLKRRSGWFLQTNEAMQFRVGINCYDVAIVPAFLYRVLSISIDPGEWRKILESTLASIAPTLVLDDSSTHGDASLKWYPLFRFVKGLSTRLKKYILFQVVGSEIFVFSHKKSKQGRTSR